MRFTLAAMTAATGIVAAAGQAHAQSGWYISGSAGALFTTDTTAPGTIYSSSGLHASDTTTSSYNPGFTLGAAIGHRLPLGFRAELELGYLHNSLDTRTLHTAGTVFSALNGTKLTSPDGGDRNRFTVTANLFYDLPVSFAGVTPYVGAGVGYYHLDVGDAHFATPILFTAKGYDTSNAVILAEVGVTAAIAPGLSVVPAYRYEHYFGSEADEDSHQIKIGLRYDF
ncbi:MAG TPA: outer membrane beta-barrel protein [Rhodopila sp.]|uniref:outer membrane protein n=1 Tax=Rhodopila sp. TaxID=2480087 RepID=UPI002BF9AE70|nr:outer membrane beta-barrel protein [Rhodopila sp.]HVY15262.1 outer membrane beta-barrel protein [Rhodopila sp.]